mmetsp:Transcript_79153/g.109968  ORF Transcript_79153/g.109968 Transcript_79153/m.109968 type:complete len:375 (-) Transcript_79153:51-1175(-)
MAAYEKAPLLTAQPTSPPPGTVPDGAPPPYSWKPEASYPTPEQLAGADRLDGYTIQKLNAVNQFGLYQGNRLGETISCGCCANTYMITDRQRMTPVQGREQDMVEIPLWIVQEESDMCCRICCPQHPTMNRFYHALPPQAGQTVCGCCYTGHQFLPDRSVPVAMVVERDGCCNKWIGCFICSEKCQSEAWLHGGDVNEEVKPGSLGNSNPKIIGRSKVPRDDCCVPHLDMFESTAGTETQYAKLTGPMCFGGCLDICCNTPFYINSGVTDGKIGDVGMIEKQAPKGCLDMCCQVAGDVDNYQVVLGQPNMTPIQKANVLGTAIHVDYWFFQRDVRPIHIISNGDGSGVIYITLCNMYCKGCLIPCCITIPYGKK